ncbi:hypothetical protein MBLNU459_g7105t1 [Dothideomycetes sp. NU459]
MQITSMDMCDVLMALLSQSQYALKKSIDQITTNGHALDNSVLQESVFDLLVRVFTAPKQSKAAQESRRVARALAEWLTACNYHETVLQVQSEGLRAPETGAIAAFEALGTLVIAVFSDAQFRDDIPRAWSKDLRARLVAALSSFASLLGQWSPSQVAPRLQMIARTPPLTDGKLDFTMAEIASAVADLPISNSRVGLYVYLNAALNARPLTDDLSVLNYLHAKYQNDTQSLVVDMIVASFDVLANALQRHQPSHMILGYRSFIANKLPLLLLSLQASLYPPLTAQVCIQMAMGRVDVHPFPPLSSENEGVNEALKQSRLEFLQACLLHQLGTESAFGNAIGEVNSSINSRANRYNKDILSSQCMANVYRAEELVSELEGMQGNAGAISGALIETGIGPMPTNYSHRLVTAAVEILGADQALTAIVDEVVAQVRTGSGSVALEITTALICAPESSHSSPVLQFDGNTTQPLTHRRTLRQVLRHRLENPKDLLEMETEHVETLIRLGRRVDAQSAVSSVDHLNMPVTNLNTTDMMQDINMTGTSMSADDVALQQSTDLHDSATTDFATAMGQSMDLSAPGVAELTSMNDSNEMSMDLSENLFATGQDLTFDLGGTSQPQDQSIASSFGGQPGNGSVQTTEEDIFAGLDMGDMGDDDFTFS